MTFSRTCHTSTPSNVMFCICEWSLTNSHCCPGLSICWLGFAVPSLFLLLFKENKGSTCNLEKPEPLLCADSPCINVRENNSSVPLVFSDTWRTLVFYMPRRTALMKLLLVFLGIRLCWLSGVFHSLCIGADARISTQSLLKLLEKMMGHCNRSTRDCHSMSQKV